MTLPSIAIIGSTGNIGKFLTPCFIQALKSGKIAHLNILTTKKSDQIFPYEKDGAHICVVDYSKMETLVKSFSGVDIVVSALGTGPGTDEVRTALIEAMVTAGVKIYFPSEFGTNHYTRSKTYKHPHFQEKQDHFHQAQGKGLKAIRMLIGLIMEASFGKWFGFDTKEGVWTLVGNGETPVAVTAEKDIGRFTVEAAIMAFKDPAKTPDFFEVYSDLKSMKDYAKEFDKVAGKNTKLVFTPLNQAQANYKASNEKFEYLLQVLMGEGAYDYTNAKGNEILNPGETHWKLKKIQEYAKETQGRPWKDY